jgi:HAMP domain-containing protein
MDHRPRLSVLAEDIAGARADLAMARDRLRERGIVLDECRLRMLIAETPLADRDLHRAAGVHARARAEVDRLERALASLRDEEGRLAGRPD